MKEHRHIGAYGILIDDNKILLIKKNGGPYDGKLDLPGGTIEFKERPKEALVREFKEEVGIEVLSFKLLDIDSVNVSWYRKEEDVMVHHIAIFYKINSYQDEIKRVLEITEQNDDSKGADFYDIELLKESNISNITKMALDKLGYKILK